MNAAAATLSSPRGVLLGPRCRFLVDLKPSQVAEHLLSATMAVQPSLQEPFGLAVVEAAACGTPLAVSAVGGHLEIVEQGRTALAFEPGDVHACACAMAEILERPELARARAQLLLEQVRARFSWPQCATQYLQLLDGATLGGAGSAFFR